MIILLTLQREIKKTFPPTKRWQRKTKQCPALARRQRKTIVNRRQAESRSQTYLDYAEARRRKAKPNNNIKRKEQNV